MALPATASRRRGAIYGKKSSRSAGFSATSFEALLARTPPKSTSSLSRVSTPAKGQQHVKKLTFDEEVYDVPPSDHEGDEARLDTLLSTPSKQAVGKKSTPQSSKNKATGFTPKFTNSIDNVPARKKRKHDNDNVTKIHEPLVKSNSRDSHQGDRKRARYELHRRSSIETQDDQSSVDQLQGTDDSASFRDAVDFVQTTANRDEMDLDVNEPVAADPSDTDELQQPAYKNDRSASAGPASLTPSSNTASNLSSSPQRKATTTPRQRKLFNDLLHDRETTPVSEIRQLELNPQSKNHERVAPKALPSQRRLIDRLRGSDTPFVPPKDSKSEEEAITDVALSAVPKPPGLQRNDSGTDPASSNGNATKKQFTRAPRITYAQQRSYLSEASQGLDDLLTQPLDVEVSPINPKVTQHGKQHGHPSDFDLEDDNDDGAGQLRSIHELKLGGDAQRFDDQIITVIDDLKSTSQAASRGRRGALMKLAECLRNAPFKARVIAGNHGIEVFRCCADEADDINCTVIGACIQLLLAEPCDPRTVAQIHDAGIIHHLSRMLVATQDVRSMAKERKTASSRSTQQSVESFVDKMLSSSIPTSDREIAFSPQLVTLVTIEAFLQRSREFGNTDILLNPPAVDQVISAFETSANVAFSHIQSVRQSVQARFIIEKALSILCLLTTSSASADDNELWSTEQVLKVARVSQAILGLHSADKIALRCLSLRLLLNLADGNEINSRVLATDRSLGFILKRVGSWFRILSTIATSEDRVSEFNELVLSLGTLYNFTEVSKDVRHTLASSHASALENLVDLFNKQRGKVKEAQSLGESQANVAFGYLAALLANMCQDSHGLQRIKRKLPGQRLVSLVDAVDEFAKLHRRVDDVEDSGETWSMYTNRLQSVAETLKRSIGD
ncbi:MAG: hypothetical protein Q9159_001959 [Coniocarpon cinnabarinum]